jgi:hypothetical protein
MRTIKSCILGDLSISRAVLLTHLGNGLVLVVTSIHPFKIGQFYPLAVQSLCQFFDLSLTSAQLKLCESIFFL